MELCFRKTLHRWTEQVKVCSENGLEGPPDDAYSWRKYGQKDILGANFPRSFSFFQFFLFYFSFKCFSLLVP